jgi:hypothetical protein
METSMPDTHASLTIYIFHSFKGPRSRFRKSEFNAAESAVLTNYSGKQCPEKLMEHDRGFKSGYRMGLGSALALIRA